MNIELNSSLTHIIAFLAGLVPLLVYLLASQRKVLGYAITGSTPLVKIQSGADVNQIEIRYAGRLVSDLRSFQVVLQNIGSKDIESQMVDISFPNPVVLMNWQLAFEPETVQKPPTAQFIAPSHIQLSLELMNPGDKITLSALTANNEAGTIHLDARGSNLKLKKFDAEYFVSPIINRSVLFLSLVLFGAMMFALFNSNKFIESSMRDRIISSISVGIIYVVLTVAVYQGLTTIIKWFLRWRARLKIRVPHEE